MAPAPRIDVEAQLAPLGEREDLTGDEQVAAGLQGDTGDLPLSRVWQVVRLSADPSAPDEVLLHEV